MFVTSKHVFKIKKNVVIFLKITIYFLLSRPIVIGHFRLLFIFCVKGSFCAKPFAGLFLNSLPCRPLHKDSFWNRGTRELGNGRFSTAKPVLRGLHTKRTPSIKWTPDWVPIFSSHSYCKINRHLADTDTNVKPFWCAKPAISGHFKGFLFPKV